MHTAVPGPRGDAPHAGVAYTLHADAASPSAAASPLRGYPPSLHAEAAFGYHAHPLGCGENIVRVAVENPPRACQKTRAELPRARDACTVVDVAAVHAVRAQKSVPEEGVPRK